VGTNFHDCEEQYVKNVVITTDERTLRWNWSFTVISVHFINNNVSGQCASVIDLHHFKGL